MRHRHVWVIAVAMLLSSSAAASAQGIARSFDQLQLLVRSGDTVTVRDAQGAETSGRITAISPATLTLEVRGAPRDFREADVNLIRQRRPDSLANGALWGFVGGLAVGGAALAIAVADCPKCDNSGGWVVFPVYGALGVGVGVGIDALIRKQQVIFQRAGSARLRPAPILGRGRRGVMLSVTF